ncbi:MAG TPA: 30S ribosome-binding factor RbfA [Firmicutes bacterium]|nr:30S ribosome-binding factor RbfA [Bacillota bacterium]
MANRQGRIKAVIGKDIAEIVSREIKNPHIGMVSVNEVVVNDDYSEAKVYVTFFGDHPKTKLAELKKSEGFVRSSLAKKMDLYSVPKIKFVLDESFEKALSLDKALEREEEQLKNLKKDM